MDCFLINYCIWNAVEEVEEVQQLVQETVVKHGYRALYDLTPILKMIKALQAEIDAETKVITKEKIEEKVIHTDENKQSYFGVPQFWGEDAAYIRIEDFEKLSKEKEIFVPVFEKSYEKYRPFQSFSFLKINSKTLLNKNKKYQLESQLSEKEIVSARPPSKAHLANWDKIVDDMLAHCNAAIQILTEREEIDLGHLRRHLFIGREKAPFVKESLKNASQEVLNLKLEIEKIQHGYQSMGKG
jgi:hypothetical protein